MTLIMPGHPAWESFRQDVEEGKVHEIPPTTEDRPIDYRQSSKEILSDEKNIIAFYENIGVMDEIEKDFCKQLLQNIANKVQLGGEKTVLSLDHQRELQQKVIRYLLKK